ncbi:MAG: lipopolysaccharide biosynthesis protein [Bacteroidales bacterium]|jgi:O-antigen/teichoic acid export membrane protein|nr:lipopolysaccharide biosynthesis protein [Bacteroidales bacterium]
MDKNLKEKTITALVWNSIDKFLSQILYAIFGIVLANILFPDEFGLIAIPMAISVFLTIFTDSGFTVALVQRKEVSDSDFNTVFTFNLLLSVSLYVLLFLMAPFLGKIYHDARLVSLSRVMFFTVVIQAFGMVQSARILRAMNIRALAISNVIPLIIAGIVSVILANKGFGVWALAVQQILIITLRTTLLWLQSSWRPKLKFNKESFRNLNAVGSGMLMTSFFSTFFQQIYTFIIGKINMNGLGYYNRAETWSKMGTAAVSQTIGQSLFPALSSVQGDEERMHRVFEKMNKMTAYISFPVFIILIIVAHPIFQILFGTKWDASIFLFQLLLAKGLFFVLTTQLNQYLMALGSTKTIFKLELIKDAAIIIALFLTIRKGIEALVWGQLIAGVIHYLATMIVMGKISRFSPLRQIKNLLPYAIISIAITPFIILISYLIGDRHFLLLSLQVIVDFGLYFIANKILKSKIQKETIQVIINRIKKFHTKARK